MTPKNPPESERSVEGRFVHGAVYHDAARFLFAYILPRSTLKGDGRNHDNALCHSRPEGFNAGN